ncbi:MAG: hypothetical protein ACE5MB_10520 [Anaerolineae bacterium]
MAGHQRLHHHPCVARQLDLPVERWVLIIEVDADEPAVRVGLRDDIGAWLSPGWPTSP